MFLNRREFCASVAFGSVLLPSAAAAQFSTFYLTIIRNEDLPTTLRLSDCVYGRLFVGERHYRQPLNALASEAICDTLELPFRNNLDQISACLPGEYLAKVRTGPTVDGRNLGWRINLEGTPGRQGVQIHIGNSPQDTIGCILVGRRGKPPPAPTPGATRTGCWLSKSGIMIAGLKAIYGNDTLQRPIVVKIVNNA